MFNAYNNNNMLSRKVINPTNKGQLKNQRRGKQDEVVCVSKRDKIRH